MLFTDQRTHFAPSKRHFHSGPSLLACFVRFSIVNCLKNRLPLLQKPASNDVFYTFLRRAGFAVPEVPVICLGGRVYGWTLPETASPMPLAHQVRHIWRKPTAKPWATKSGWPIGDRRKRSLMPARS